MLICHRATHPRTRALLEDKSDCLREWLEAQRNDEFHLISPSTYYQHQFWQETELLQSSQQELCSQEICT